jgi:hypothetical protein
MHEFHLGNPFQFQPLAIGFPPRFARRRALSRNVRHLKMTVVVGPRTLNRYTRPVNW